MKPLAESHLDTPGLGVRGSRASTVSVTETQPLWALSSGVRSPAGKDRVPGTWGGRTGV